MFPLMGLHPRHKLVARLLIEPIRMHSPNRKATDYWLMIAILFFVPFYQQISSYFPIEKGGVYVYSYGDVQ